MSHAHPWPEPAWLASVPAADRERCRLRFFLALASIYANPEGSPIKLSKDLGLTETAISSAKTRGTIAAETALKIEQKLGADLFPWQNFLPALVLDLAE